MWFPFSRYKVVGHSMEPIFRDGDTLWVNRLVYLFSSPRERDIVVFNHNNKFLMKRVSKVGKNGYLLIGDNKKDSLDSRHLGSINKRQILGRVVTKYWLTKRRAALLLVSISAANCRSRITLSTSGKSVGEKPSHQS